MIIKEEGRKRKEGLMYEIFSVCLNMNLAKASVRYVLTNVSINFARLIHKNIGGTMTSLIAIGGAMDVEEPIIFEEFVKLAGRMKANIVVLPQASSLAQTGKEYSQTFQKLDIIKKKPISLEFRTRAEADQKSNLEALRRATGIFIAGGTQMRLASLIVEDHDRLWAQWGDPTRTHCSVFLRFWIHRQYHL